MKVPLDFSVHLRLKVDGFLEEDKDSVIAEVKAIFKQETSYFEFTHIGDTLYVDTTTLAFKPKEAIKLARELYDYFTFSTGLSESEYQIDIRCGDIYKVREDDDIPF